MPRISFQGTAPSPFHSGSRALDTSFERVPKFPSKDPSVGTFGRTARRRYCA